MTQEIAIRNETQVSPWRAFADQNLVASIAGDLIKFAKGKWYRGESKNPIAGGARFVCNMDEIYTGWQHWFDGQPVEHRIARITEFPRPINREDLGQMDRSKWELDAAGNPKDPWSPVDRMIMREASGGEEVVTFTTSSVGGRDALSKLCQAFANSHKAHPGKFPVVELNVDSYRHKMYGEIAKPKFVIVDWVGWGGPEPEDKPDFHSDEIPF
jgi:hypothetical protein